MGRMKDTNTRLLQDPMDVYQLGSLLHDIYNFIMTYNNLTSEQEVDFTSSASFKPADYQRGKTQPAVLRLATEIHKCLRTNATMLHLGFMHEENAFHQMLKNTALTNTMLESERENLLTTLYKHVGEGEKKAPAALDAFAVGLRAMNRDSNLAEAWEVIAQYQQAYTAIYRLVADDVEHKKELETADEQFGECFLSNFEQTLTHLKTVDVSLAHPENEASPIVLKSLQNTKMHAPYTLSEALVGFAAGRGQTASDQSSAVNTFVLNKVGSVEVIPRTWHAVREHIEAALLEYAEEHHETLDVPAILQANKLSLGPHATAGLKARVADAMHEIAYMRNQMAEEDAEVFESLERDLADYSGVIIQSEWLKDKPASLSGEGAARA